MSGAPRRDMIGFIARRRINRARHCEAHLD
jgi:hypothetical protein